MFLKFCLFHLLFSIFIFFRYSYKDCTLGQSLFVAPVILVFVRFYSLEILNWIFHVVVKLQGYIVLF